MKKFEFKYVGISMDYEVGSYAVVLESLADGRQLSLYISEIIAFEIQSAVNDKDAAVPYTHTAWLQTITESGETLAEVVIHDITRDKVVLAVLRKVRGSEVSEQIVSAVDGVVLAVVSGCRIMVDHSLFEKFEKVKRDEKEYDDICKEVKF